MRSNKTIVLLLVILTSLAFSTAINNDFTNWDDNNYITNNPHIKDFSGDGLKYLLTERTGLGGTRLTLISFWIDHKLWKLNPVPYHIENILWHILNTLLVFFLFIRLNNNRRISFIVAILFAIHPMHVESVAWISERKDVLFTFFLLLSLHSYLSYIKTERIGKRVLLWFLFSLFFYLSWHAKFSAVILPFLLFLIDYHQKRKFTWLIIIEKLPILLFLGWEVYRIAFGSHVHVPAGKFKREMMAHPSKAYSLYDKTLLAAYSLMFYIIKFFAPVNLTAIVPYPAKHHGSFPDIYFHSLIVIAILSLLFILFIIRYGRKYRLYVFGILFFLVSVAPFLHYISIKGVVVVADRYTYVPYIGLNFVVALLLDQVLNSRFKTYGLSVLIFTIFLLGYLSFERNKVWKNNITLFTDVLNKNPRVIQAYNNRGNAYNDLKKYDLALKDFNKAIHISPKFKFLYNNRSFTWAEMDCTRLAFKDLNTAIKLDPYYLDPYLNKGNLLIKNKKYKEAAYYYTKALKIAPRRSTIYVQRARVNILLSKKDSAIADYSNAIRFFPNNKDAYFERGRIYSYDNQYALAKHDFEKAIEIDSEEPIYYSEMGDLLNNSHEYKIALEYLNKAILLKSDLAPALSNRGITNFSLGNIKQAMNDFNTAILYDSTFAKAYSNRGYFWAAQQKFDLAIKDFTKAIMINPSDFLSYVNRGNVYYQIKERELACKDWQTALDLNFMPVKANINAYCK